VKKNERTAVENNLPNRHLILPATDQTFDKKHINKYSHKISPQDATRDNAKYLSNRFEVTGTMEVEGGVARAATKQPQPQVGPTREHNLWQGARSWFGSSEQKARERDAAGAAKALASGLKMALKLPENSPQRDVLIVEARW